MNNKIEYKLVSKIKIYFILQIYIQQREDLKLQKMNSLR